MADLAQLLADLLPTARMSAGQGAGDPDGVRAAAREVGWVRLVRARVPALDALDAGDLVLVPLRALAVVAPAPEDVAALAAALAAGGAAGAVLLAADERDREAMAPVATLLAADLVAAGVPSVEAIDADPAGLERTAIAWLVNRRAALEARAEELERRLAAIALADGGHAALVAAIGGYLGRAVVLEGRRGDVLALHAPEAPPTAADAARRYLAGRGGVALRLALPAPAPGIAGAEGAGEASGTPIGHLVLLGDVPATEGERLACERVAALLALELGRDVAVARAREEGRRGAALPQDGPPWVVVVARQAADGDPDPARREAIRAELRLLAPARRLALRGSVESLEYRLVAVADTDDPGGLLLAERVARLLGRVVAVSRPFADPADRPTAEADARATLEAVEAVAAGPRVVRTDRLPAYRILGGLRDLPDAERLAGALLAPALAGRPATVDARLATLRAVLDAAGPIEAAHALGIHRNTIAHRIRRLEEIGGWDLSDPDLRLALSVALRIVQDDRADGRG